MPQLAPTDPLFPTQWGLQNRGQQGGHVGTDINLLPVLGTGFGQVDGTGVRVAVVDDGVELTHPDLAANIDVASSYDAKTNTAGNGAGGPVDRADDHHGTAVAGIIGEARNGIGGIGVAPGVTLVSERIDLKAPPVSTGDGSSDVIPGSEPEIISAFTYALSARIDVVSNSWGAMVPFAYPFFNSPAKGYAPSLAALAMHGRDGKGTVVVFSNGNDRTSGANGVLDGSRSSRFVIAIAALDNGGVRSSYSTPGANILVTAPGGGSTNQLPTKPGNAITTTDLIGMDGYSEPLSSGDYTYAFDGTSAATPFVSGVVALMLQANPDLGYRDVQQILAYSARLTDPAALGWVSSGDTAINGGGLHFNADYGFGLVDAHAAVRLAQSYRQIGLTSQDESNVTMAVGTYQSPGGDNIGNGIAVGKFAPNPDNTSVAGTGLGIRRTFTLGAGSVEHLELNLNLVVADTSRISVALMSPSGRAVVLLPARTNGEEWPGTFSLGTDAFWGEQANGTWKLVVASELKRDADGNVLGNAGQLNAATLTAYTPAEAPTVNNMIYTDDFAAMAADQPGRSVITGRSGVQNVLNLSATTGANVLDLTGRIGTMAGQNVSISSGTTFDTVFGGDGDNTIFAGPNDQTIHTGYGRTTLNLMAGDDTVFSKGQDTIFAGSGQSVIFGQGPGMFAVGGAGAVTVSGLSGRDTLFGGDGGGTFFGGSGGGNVLVGGSGSSTIVGGGDGDMLFATGTRETMLVAGSGNETLFGGASTADNVYFASGGSVLIGGGKGSDRFFLGSGSATLDGGGGGDLLVFRAGLGGGTVRVNNFNTAAGDRLTLQGYAAGEAARDLAGATVSAAGETTLRLSDNTRITFAGVTSLNAMSFV